MKKYPLAGRARPSGTHRGPDLLRGVHYIWPRASGCAFARAFAVAKQSCANKEFTLVVNGSPQNDPAEYEFTFYKFRMHFSLRGTLAKSAAETKMSCSFPSSNRK